MKALVKFKKIEKKASVVVCALVACAVFFAECKSAPPVKKAPLPQKTGHVQTQIADQFYMSYAQLPCDVFFSDGSSLRLITDIRGTLHIPLKAGQSVVRLEYDFSSYKKHVGRVLARNNFRGYRRFKRQRGKRQVFDIQLHDKARFLLMLPE